MSFAALSPIQFKGSIPLNESEISSFNDIYIEFDFSEIQEQFGSIENWGVCYNASYKDWAPETSNTITLYKGDSETGEVLDMIASNYNQKQDNWTPDNKIKVSFPSVEVTPGQVYTIVADVKVYAINKETLDKTTTNNLKDNPIVLTFYGASDVKKVISVISSSLENKDSFEVIDKINIEFSNDIKLGTSQVANIEENNTSIFSSEELVISSTDKKVLEINFNEKKVYYGHDYEFVIPAGTLMLAEDDEIVNSEIRIPFKGASFYEFGYKRITPSPKNASLIEEIQVTFDFPEGCGFINMEDAGVTGYPMKVYKGEEANEENYLTTINGETTDGGSLLFKPKYDFDAETKYTFVIEEGVVKPWIIGGTRGQTLPDYKCNPVIITYSTPEIAKIDKVVLTPQGSELPELGSLEDGIKIPVEQYVFDETDYAFTSSGKKFYGDDIFPGYHPLYETGTEEDILIGYYFFYPRNTSDNGCYLELSTIGQDNLPVLLEGKEYEFRFPEGAYVAEQNLLKKYSGNDAFNYRFKGTTSPINDFGLKANIDDRLHSHADVFSFVTENEIKAGENAKMLLKDGEENVAEAPVYVSREANGHRVYADFGGKKLDAGKSYDVVLPEGSVYAANGIVNNPEIKSAITAMPETPAAPEFISVTLNIDEYASATYRMVKGQESVVNLKAGEDWKLESLSLNGEDVTADVAENGLYTLPALDEDANLDATYAYAHAIDYDYETGVGSIEDLPYSLSKDGSHVVISGLNGGEQIAIYTMGGMKIASLDTVPADMHEASIALPEGQIYIVMINNTSIKWKH